MSDQELKLRITGEGASAEAALAKVGAASAAMADKTDAASKRMSDSVGSVGKAAESTRASFVAVGAAAVTAVAAMTGGEFTRTLAEWDRLNASLNTVTNSMAQATAAGAMLKQFAQQTPYDVRQVTEAFIKLKSLGLDASEKSLRAYGNTAAAMGKSLMQYIEAVADASTGEFERLKEFGIKASQQNDKVAFTFRGNTTTIKNDAASIIEYLKKIGETYFSRGMANQMDKVGGRLSNLQDQFSNFADFLGNLGGRDLLKNAFDGMTEYLAALQKQLNGMYGTGIQAQIDALEGRAAEAARVLEQLHDLNKSPAGALLTSDADISARQNELIDINRKLIDLRRQKAELDAKSKTDLSAATAAMGSGASTTSAAEAQKAATEAQKQRMADIKASQEAITAQHEAEARENAAGMAKELEEAKDNAAKKLEIEQRYAESNRKLKLEELAATIETQELLKKAGADKAESAEIDGKILALQQEINAERKIGAIEAETYGLKAKEISDDQAKSLQALADAAKSAKAQVIAAQDALAFGGDAQSARAAADRIKRQDDIEQQVLKLREKYSDTAAKDQAEKSFREQADNAQRLEALTRESTDRQTSYYVGAWEQAGRNIHDALAGMFNSLLTGQASSMGGIFQQFKALGANVISNYAASAIEGYIGKALFSGAATGAVGSAAGGAGSSLGIGGALSYVTGGAPLLTGMTSPFLASVGMRAGTAMGLGGTASSYLGLAGYYSPWGAVAGLAANAMGLKGGSPVANMVLPTVGSIAGSIGGSMAAGAIGAAVGSTATAVGATTAAGGAAVGASAGSVVPIIGTIIGAIIGAAASTAFNAAQPHGGAAVAFNRDNSYGTAYIKDHAGSQASTLLGFGQYMAPTIAGMERAFGVELGKFTLAFEQKNRDIYFRGYDSNGQFSSLFSKNAFDEKGKLSEESVKDKLDQLSAAVLKREEVLRQIDDSLVRGVVSTSSRLTEIQARYKVVEKIRAFEGERDPLGVAADKLLNDFLNYQTRIKELTGGVNEFVELEKLSEAFTRQFSGQVQTVRESLASLSGAGEGVAASVRKVDDAVRQIRAQNAQLERTAKRSGGAVNYTPITEAEIETARQAALARVQTEFLASLRQLSGATVPLSVQIVDLVTQFKALTSEAQTAGVAASTVGAVLAAQFGGLILSTAGPLLGERSNIAALKARITGADTTGAALADAERALANNTNREAELSLIGQVRQAIESRYGAELSRLQALESAYQRIADYTKGLRLGGLSTLTPAARFNAARSDYAAMLGKARTGDAEALAGLSGSADTYLQQAQGYYASGDAYQQIFKAVYADLGALGAKAGGASGDIASLQASTVAKLDGLDAKTASALDYARSQLQAGLDTVGALGVLNETQTKALSELIAMTGQQGVSNLALGALVANLQGQAATATGSGAITGIGTGGPTTAGQTQSAGFQAAFESARKSNGFNVTDAKRLERWLNANLTGQGYNAEDWALWRAVGQTIEGYSQQMSASGKAGHSAQAHRIAAGINSKLPDDMRFFAVGGLAKGWAMVGERGPELVNFTDPGRVYTASQTAQAINQAQGGDGAGRLAEAVEKLGKILEVSNGKTAGVLRGELGRILEAILMGHGVQAETADRIAREVRMGLAKRAA